MQGHHAADWREPRLKKDLLEYFDRIGQMVHDRPFGLVLDLDGTISEIAHAPEEAIVSDAIRRHLQVLVSHLDLVAVISGRPARDLKTIVGVAGVTYVGNHGLDSWESGTVRLCLQVKPLVATVSRALQEVGDQLSMPGVVLENKGASAAIHYRQATEAAPARAAILTALRKSPTARKLKILEGKMVVELRPPLSVDKGKALASLARRHRLRSAIYIGDDTTDIDAFVTLGELRAAGKVAGLAVAVCDRETPPAVVAHADAFLGGVAAVEHFLLWLSEEAERPFANCGEASHEPPSVQLLAPPELVEP